MEMKIYCRYLLDKEVDDLSLNLFERAACHEEVKLSARELKLLHFLLRHPWCVPYIDAAMGLFMPHHTIRRRMIIAFAILETNPLYYDFFSPRVMGNPHLLVLAFKSLLEAVKAIAGRFLLFFF